LRRKGTSISFYVRQKKQLFFLTAFQTLYNSVAESKLPSSFFGKNGIQRSISSEELIYGKIIIHILLICRNIA